MVPGVIEDVGRRTSGTSGVGRCPPGSKSYCLLIDRAARFPYLSSVGSNARLSLAASSDAGGSALVRS
ncbi:MAG TPA: hypothetical protein VLQ79_07450, partial [Myxococcaceae bacterium]|nr:hypothetical protein [Myxococcaceae bacterium]